MKSRILKIDLTHKKAISKSLYESDLKIQKNFHTKHTEENEPSESINIQFH